MGIELSDSGELAFTKNKTEVRANLIKICDDIVSGELTLKQLLLTEDKNQYLADLIQKGFNTNPAKQEPIRKATKKGGLQRNPLPRVVKRKTLIPKETDYNIEWSVGQQKLNTLWQQLQHLLEFDKHDISIAIVFRVLLEQITSSAFDRKNLEKPNKNTLQNRIVALSEYLANEGEYDHDHHKDIKRRIEDPKSLSSIGALQRILHARQEIPAKSDMVALWDSLELFTLGALKK